MFELQYIFSPIINLYLIIQGHFTDLALHFVYGVCLNKIILLLFDFSKDPVL